MIRIQPNGINNVIKKVYKKPEVSCFIETHCSSDLIKCKPDVSKDTAITMHHDLSGDNCAFRNALKYISNGFQNCTEYMIKDAKSLEKYMQEIDAKFEKLPPLKTNCVVYRGRREHYIKSCNTDFEIMDKAKIGDIVIPDTGYSYAAFEQNLADCWGGKDPHIRSLMYEIHIPRGAKVSRNLEHSGEVIMPRGAKYIIKDKKVDKDGSMYVVLEYLLPKLPTIV